MEPYALVSSSGVLFPPTSKTPGSRALYRPPVLSGGNSARESGATAAVSAGDAAMTQGLAHRIWPDNLGDPVHVRIFEFCTFPGLPHCSLTCRSFRALIQPELASGAMPHLRVPRDTRRVQRAIETAPPDGTIWVTEGVYHERISLSQTNVHLVGVGGAENTVIGDGCEVTEGKPRLTGLTFKRDASWDHRHTHTLVMRDTRAVLEGCVVEGGAGVEVKGRVCNPQMLQCEIRDSSSNGVSLDKHARGVFTRCDIHSNAWNNVDVQDSNPQFNSCQIRDGKQGGVFAHRGGRGVFTKCDIHSNQIGVIVEGSTRGSSNPRFHSCQIRDSKGNGVYVHKGGRGVFTECDIHSNAHPGVKVALQGRGTFTDCSIHGNKCAGMQVQNGGSPVVQRCEIYDNKSIHSVFDVRGGVGVSVFDSGAGRFEDCNIHDNATKDWEIQDGCNTIVQGPSSRFYCLPAGGFQGLLVN